MIIADTNLIAYRLIAGEQSDLAQAIWHKDHEWVVPPLWRHELLNVLVVSVRHGVLSQEASLMLFDRAVRLFGARERQPHYGAVLKLAVEKAITAYDAQFVLLARETGAPLVTSDKELLRKFPEDAVSLKQFAQST